jgi:hypothetical protein
MSARRSRQEARERIRKAFEAELDRIIPADPQRPLKGSRFLHWELQVQQLKRTVLPVVLEERAALEDNAQVAEGGHCPYCGSDAVYLERQTTQTEVHSPDGPVVLQKQHCRCRCCDGSFSPSEP